MLCKCNCTCMRETHRSAGSEMAPIGLLTVDSDDCLSFINCDAYIIYKVGACGNSVCEQRVALCSPPAHLPDHRCPRTETRPRVVCVSIRVPTGLTSPPRRNSHNRWPCDCARRKVRCCMSAGTVEGVREGHDKGDDLCILDAGPVHLGR